MKQITLNIPESKFNFIIDLLKKFDFVKVVKQDELKSQSEDEKDDEHNDWTRFGVQNLAKAYGNDEPDYDNMVVKEPNPEYNP